MTKWLLPAAKIAVPLLAAFFIGRMIHTNWQQVRAEAWRVDPGLLAASFALAAPWYLARPFGWNQLFRGFGHDLPYWDIYRVYRKAELSRYVPGGIWQFASRVYLTRRYGVSAAECLAATMVDMVLAALAAMVPAAWLAGAASAGLGTWQQGVLLAFPLLAVCVIVPRVLNAWAEPLARLAKQPYRRLEMRASRMFLIWALYVATWICLACGIALFARALLPGIGWEDFALIAGCYALAWLVALLTMVAPAGMGVREGILGLLLGRAVAAGTAMTLAVTVRLWIVGMELAWLAAGALMPRGTRGPEGQSSRTAMLR